MEYKAVLAAIILSIFLSLESVVIRFINVKKYKVPSEQMVILVELFKLGSSLIFYYYPIIYKRYFSDYIYYRIDRQNDQDETVDWNWRNIYYYLFPAVVYTTSNNVTYWALAEMTPAMYNLLMNIKIPLTGIMAYIFLSYRMTTKFVISFIVLFASTTLASLKLKGSDVSLDVSSLGLLYMFIYTSCSSGGAILMEYITKLKFGGQDIYIQNIKFSIVSIFCNLVVILIRFEIPFTNLNPLHLIVVVISGIYGLITAVVIKFGGSILKTYSVSTSVFFSALLTYLIWNTHFSWNFYIGSLCCLYAVHLYSKELYKIKSEHSICEEINALQVDTEEDPFMENIGTHNNTRRNSSENSDDLQDETSPISIRHSRINYNAIN